MITTTQSRCGDCGGALRTQRTKLAGRHTQCVRRGHRRHLRLIKLPYRTVEERVYLYLVEQGGLYWLGGLADALGLTPEAVQKAVAQHPSLSMSGQDLTELVIARCDCGTPLNWGGSELCQNCWNASRYPRRRSA
jgi:hypothetical protein